ncbi:solute carrier family 25 member 44 isoform X7 [Physeter macrocephalus]|uniref:Solute carrier family 25 member 44 isoform X7 n=1 Tax=Physeter macrocephalus TaxID=9755 RepID=A0A2Y9EYJ0_PHYMC|nr:solute carrier family 25 member 44 isoform X7 [Physeter catodon]|eukprot:XP_007110434.1 polyamine-modulated factor 1 isoform X3 [Physeter catodon]
MAEASGVNVGSGCEEKGPEELSQQSARPGTTISRVKLFDTMVDTFIQKLVAAGSYQRFTDCYKCFYQLQPEMTQRIYDKFVTQLQTSIQEEISEIKAEGNLEAVLNALDAIVEESKDCKEPACSGTPCSAVCRNRRPRTGSWQMPSWPGAGRWRSCSCRARPGSRPGRLYTENRRSWWPC